MSFCTENIPGFCSSTLAYDFSLCYVPSFARTIIGSVITVYKYVASHLSNKSVFLNNGSLTLFGSSRILSTEEPSPSTNMTKKKRAVLSICCEAHWSSMSHGRAGEKASKITQLSVQGWYAQDAAWAGQQGNAVYLKHGPYLPRAILRTTERNNHCYGLCYTWR